MGDRLKSASGTARLLKSPSVRVIVGAAVQVSSWATTASRELTDL